MALLPSNSIDSIAVARQGHNQNVVVAGNFNVIKVARGEQCPVIALTVYYRRGHQRQLG